MSAEENSIKEPLLRELVRAGIAKARISGHGTGFAVSVQLGVVEKMLTTSRGAVRLFASLDTAGAFVRNIGLPQFEVDMSEYEPGRLRKPRPDRAAALRGTRTKMQQQILSF